MTADASNSMPSTNSASARPLAAVILAAGRGTRMNSDLPKVVHEVAGKPMVQWVVEAVRGAGANPIVVVVGHGADLVRAIFDGQDDVHFVVQEEQLGTGHATDVCRPQLAGFDGDVLVFAGDGPLLRSETIHAMLERHRGTDAQATLATAVVDDPTGYGRILRDRDNRFRGIVEHRNATDNERAIREIYPSYACFRCAPLFDALDALQPDGLSGEYYLTEVPAMLASTGGRVEVVDAVPPEDVLSINTVEQLAEVDAVLRRRIAEAPATEDSAMENQG
jgi:bifunctional UDP-N-acetylglucosamine pyrophosphorylase/glucosamine-1-phosphate N-acetyltransferase